MEIIKKYIYAIQRRLPSKNQEDISREINSLIYDELEGKYGKKDEYPSEEIETVLKEMGHPREVAARYRGDKQLLIGEELFPIYKMVVAIVIGATTLGLFISYIVKMLTFGDVVSAGIYLKTIAQLIGSILTAAISTVGSITIVFALIQHFGSFKEEKVDFYEDWTPKDLPDLPEEKDRVRIWEPIVAMFFIIVGFVFVNVFIAQGNLPVMINGAEDVKILPVFNTETIKNLLPLWNLSFALSFILQVFLLIQRKWTLGTRLFEIGISLLGIVILVTMLNSPMIFAVEELLTKYGAKEWIDVLNQYYYVALKVFIGFSILGIIVNTIKLIVNQARKANV